MLSCPFYVVTPGTVTISLGADIAFGSTQLLAINLAQGVTLDIVGNGHTLEGGSIGRGLFVYAGTVSVESLSIDNMAAYGGTGGGGGGGGAGLGGGLFVGANLADNPGYVTLTDVSFSNDTAIGGQGGVGNSGGGGGLGGNGSSGVSGGGGGIGGDGGDSLLPGGTGIVP